jgi:hypothetical protein
MTVEARVIATAKLLGYQLWMDEYDTNGISFARLIAPDGTNVLHFYRGKKDMPAEYFAYDHISLVHHLKDNYGIDVSIWT